MAGGWLPPASFEIQDSRFEDSLLTIHYLLFKFRTAFLLLAPSFLPYPKFKIRDFRIRYLQFTICHSKLAPRSSFFLPASDFRLLTHDFSRLKSSHCLHSVDSRHNMTGNTRDSMSRSRRSSPRCAHPTYSGLPPEFFRPRFAESCGRGAGRDAP